MCEGKRTFGSSLSASMLPAARSLGSHGSCAEGKGEERKVLCAGMYTVLRRMIPGAQYEFVRAQYAATAPILTPEPITTMDPHEEDVPLLVLPAIPSVNLIQVSQGLEGGDVAGLRSNKQSRVRAYCCRTTMIVSPPPDSNTFNTGRCGCSHSLSKISLPETTYLSLQMCAIASHHVLEHRS